MLISWSHSAGESKIYNKSKGALKNILVCDNAVVTRKPCTALTLYLQGSSLQNDGEPKRVSTSEKTNERYSDNLRDTSSPGENVTDSAF